MESSFGIRLLLYIISKARLCIKTMSTPQNQLQQQLNATSKCHSPFLDDIESVSKRDRQEKGKKKKVLIVDDEPDITYTLSKVLEASGFSELDVYNEPLLALQNFKSCDYSLLITDIAMPKMNGFELYEHIKKIDTEIKVIFMTASNINYEALNELLQVDLHTSYQSKETTLFGVDKELALFIRKPVEMTEFIQRVNNQLQSTAISQTIKDVKIQA